MKLLNYFKTLLHPIPARDAEPIQGRSYSPAQAWLQAGASEWMPGANLCNALEQSVWVYSCVTAISEQIAHIPFVFSQGQNRGETRVEKGEVVSLFNRPERHLNKFLFWELLCQWLLLRGKVYLVALDKFGSALPVHVPTRRGPKPARLVLLNPDRMRMVISQHELAGYHYSAGLNDPIPSQTLLPEEVVNIRMAYAYNALEGLAPLGVALLAAQTDYAAAQCMKGLMLNNADAGQIVTTPEHLTPTQIVQFKAALQERKRMAGSADRPLFLTDGAKVETPALSLADLQFLENRKFNRQEICAIFRVPQEILGYTEDANRAVAEAVRLSFIENRIAPFCQRLESELDPIVKLFGPELWGFFDIEALPIMQAARRLRYQGARQGFEMGVPLNVLNQLLDLGLPRLPHGERSFLPGSWQEVGSANAEATRRMLCPIWDKHSVVRQLESRLSRFFFEQRSRILARLESAAKAAEPEMALFELEAESKRLSECVKPLLRMHLEQLVAGLRQEKGHEANSLSLELAPYLQEREAALGESNQARLSELQRSLAEGLRLGEDGEQLARRVKTHFHSAAQEARELAATEAELALAYAKSIAALATLEN